MSVIKDKSYKVCVCGVDTHTQNTKTAKQRVLTWMTTTVAIGFLFIVAVGGFHINEWTDPKGLVVLGLLAYSCIGIGIKTYQYRREKPRHKLFCILRRSYLEVV
jgi:hypothetical protein